MSTLGDRNAKSYRIFELPVSVFNFTLEFRVQGLGFPVQFQGAFSSSASKMHGHNGTNL